MDTLSPKERSKRMSLIRGTGSAPEMKRRRLVHGMGFRYRLYVKELPGKPDLVFPSRRAVIFKGRHAGLRPRWDVLHPGRPWAERCQARDETAEQIISEARDYLRNNPPPDDSTMITA